MSKDARITDICDHGPQIITGAGSVVDENQNSSGIGDLYACPIHGVNPIVSGAGKTIFEGTPTSRIGDVTACGAVIVTGAAKCTIGS